MYQTSRALVVLFALTIPSVVPAHHSFAVHYDGERTVVVAGVVADFRFRNPHGMIIVNEDIDGAVRSWRIETNSPNILRRRGWSEDSLRPGDAVTIEGFPAVDGSHAMRVFRVQFDDGSELIGQRPAVGIER